jgi:diguanylate cyclase (GGDEF)-like protein
MKKKRSHIYGKIPHLSLVEQIVIGISSLSFLFISLPTFHSFAGTLTPAIFFGLAVFLSLRQFHKSKLSNYKNTFDLLHGSNRIPLIIKLYIIVGLQIIWYILPSLMVHFLYHTLEDVLAIKLDLPTEYIIKCALLLCLYIGHFVSQKIMIIVQFILTIPSLIFFFTLIYSVFFRTQNFSNFQIAHSSNLTTSVYSGVMLGLYVIATSIVFQSSTQLDHDQDSPKTFFQNPTFPIIGILFFLAIILIGYSGFFQTVVGHNDQYGIILLLFKGILPIQISSLFSAIISYSTFILLGNLAIIVLSRSFSKTLCHLETSGDNEFHGQLDFESSSLSILFSMLISIVGIFLVPFLHDPILFISPIFIFSIILLQNIHYFSKSKIPKTFARKLIFYMFLALQFTFLIYTWIQNGFVFSIASMLLPFGIIFMGFVFYVGYKNTLETRKNNHLPRIHLDSPFIVVWLVILLLCVVVSSILLTWFTAKYVSGSTFFDRAEILGLILVGSCFATIGLASILTFPQIENLRKLSKRLTQLNSILEVDIRKRMEAESSLLLLSKHDELTKLGNRGLLQDQLSHNLIRIQKNSINAFTLILINLNRFKSINDSLGIGIGDEVLIQVAQRLQDTFGNTGQLFRLGSDEFGIIIPETQLEKKPIKDYIDGIFQLFAVPFLIGKRKIFLTISMGVNYIDSFELSPQSLIKGTSVALHEARKMGKGKYAIFNQEQYERVMSILKMEQSLPSAINNREFKLFYQPIFNLQTRSLSGFETLIRWPWINNTIVQPSKFIPLAEDTELVIPLTWWILEEACKHLRHLQKHYNNPELTIAVNFSIKQFYEPDIIQRIHDIAEQNQIPLHCLKIEITESIIQDSEEILQTMIEMSKQGIHLHLDDFGTGYSSLAYLNNLPIRAVKIDKSFIRDLDNYRSKQITKAMIDLAHGLELKTIVEGVETHDQLEFVKKIGAQMGQGYLFSKPLSHNKSLFFSLPKDL